METCEGVSVAAMIVSSWQGMWGDACGEVVVFDCTQMMLAEETREGT